MLKPKSDISVLLKENLESYYWMGFLMADACISEKSRIRINLSEKDKNHLLRFAKYIKCNNIQHITPHSTFGVFKMILLQIRDHTLVPKLTKKFEFKKAKTRHPPILKWLNGNKFLSFFAGYIDGDGSIDYHITHKKWGQFRIRMSAHRSWFSIFKRWELKLYKILNITWAKKRVRTKINGKGYARLELTDSRLLKAFKEQLLKLNLPLLSRKWDIIKI